MDVTEPYPAGSMGKNPILKPHNRAREKVRGSPNSS